MDFEAVAAHAKAVIGSHTFQHGGNFVVAELDKLVALLTDKMIMLRVPVVVLIDFTIVGSSDFTDQAGFFKRTERSVNCSSTH